jgi:hypothetical protein
LALQSGSSAVNKQPWRFVIAGDVVHVFTASDAAVALFDIGIALAGINLYAQAGRRTVAFEVIAEPPQTPLGGKYIITATISPAPAAES